MTNGRGAWTVQGKEFPTLFFEYRPGQLMLGFAASSNLKLDPTAISQRAVYYGVAAIQQRLGNLGYYTGAVDGLFGPLTSNATVSFQRMSKLVADGIIGPRTATALFLPTVAAQETRYSIPSHLLAGLVQQESGFDPGAVGFTTPDDKGLAQFHTLAGETTWWTAAPVPFTIAQAFLPTWAIPTAADRMVNGTFGFKHWRTSGATVEMAWRCAVLQHNNPNAAKDYFTTGKYTSPAAEKYVTAVYTAAGAFA